MRELIELRLPQLVEARRKRESASSEFDLPDMKHDTPLHLSQSSYSSDPYSPVTPTFSLRGHSRFPSSSSSLASSPTTMRDSLDGYASKRPLTEVKEEPQHERDVDLGILESPLRQLETTREEEANMMDISDYDLPSAADYDWVDSPCDEEDFDFGASKRQRADDPPTGLTSRFGTRFPTLSRKWKSRKDARNSSLPESTHESIISRSRASSMRSPSLLDTRTDSLDRRDVQIPLTPDQSFVVDRYDDTPSTPIRECSFHEGDDNEAPEGLARTPLLPPVLAMLRTDDEPIQSPLQSPKIVESPGMVSPFESSSPHTGLPSPPLSTKPSVSSFHHRAIAPTSEIPPMILAEPSDEWSLKLGHANFTILPEPYLPSSSTVEGCRRHRGDWETARNNFMKHLARTGEHYSTTSKIYQLTQEKWTSIDAMWKQNHEQAVAAVARHSQDALDLSQHSLQEATTPVKMTLIPAPWSDGKFPKVGDEGIVGPMEVAKPIAQRSSRKRAFWKFLQGVLPTTVAFGRSPS